MLAGCATGREAAPAAASGPRRPNIILAMTDDQGWTDTGYQGHPHVRTPTLDEMARIGVRFDRWYSGHPTCSPTRGSCLTGRHPYRYGIWGANSGTYEVPSRFPLPPSEITLAEILKGQGYSTGHFGKWHLGDFAGEMQSSPADNGFDEFFSTRRKVPTLDPFDYFTNDGPYTEELKGDDSAIILDRALPFMRNAVDADQPFFTVLWFHAPHWPVIAPQEYRSIYKDAKEGEQHYWGVLSAVDTQLWRLRMELRALGVADDTMLWFCSDNGPANNARRPTAVGTKGPLRGWKGQLYEGGIRVPGLLEYPNGGLGARTISAACSTSDYLPTILSHMDLPLPDDRPYDGMDIWPLLEDPSLERGKPIGFHKRQEAAYMTDRYKLKVDLADPANTVEELFDLQEDVGETRNLVADRPDVAKQLRTELDVWRADVVRDQVIV
jgi:arylsulfatase A-like enzyme